MKKVFCFVFLQFYRGGDCRFGFGQTNPLVRRKAGWREGRKGVVCVGGGGGVEVEKEENQQLAVLLLLFFVCLFVCLLLLFFFVFFWGGGVALFFSSFVVVGTVGLVLDRQVPMYGRLCGGTERGGGGKQGEI